MTDDYTNPADGDQSAPAMAPASSSPDEAAADTRKTGRLYCAGVQCDFGSITNLSAGGACVRGRRLGRLRPGLIVTISLDTEFGHAPVRAKVVRVSKRGWFSYDVGLQFLEVSEFARAMLGQVAYASPQEAHQLYHSMRRAG